MPAPTEARKLRALLLWCARSVVGEGAGIHTGRIAVTIAAPALGVELTVRPTAAADGLAAGLAVGEAAATASRAEKLASGFLSQAERVLLADLAEHEPCTATQVAERVRSAHVTKSAFWSLWSNLQQRGLIQHRDDDRYELAADWLRELLPSAECV